MESHKIQVCCSKKCHANGSDGVFTRVEHAFGDGVSVERSDDCFGYCAMGPNVAVDGNILHRMKPGDAESRIRREIANPSLKLHGIGSKTIDDLDSVLDNL